MANFTCRESDAKRKGFEGRLLAWCNTRSSLAGLRVEGKVLWHEETSPSRNVEGGLQPLDVSGDRSSAAKIYEHQEPPNRMQEVGRMRYPR